MRYLKYFKLLLTKVPFSTLKFNKDRLLPERFNRYRLELWNKIFIHRIYLWENLINFNLNTGKLKILQNMSKRWSIILIIVLITIILMIIFQLIILVWSSFVAYVSAWIKQFVVPKQTDKKKVPPFDKNTKSEIKNVTLPIKILNEDNNLKNNKDLKLIKHMYVLTKSLQKLHDYERLASLKRLLRPDLNFIYTTPITSNNAELGTLRIWTNATRNLIHNKYVFDKKEANKSITVNLKYSPLSICLEYGLIDELLTSEPDSRRVLLDLFNDCTQLNEIDKKLSKTTFLNKQNLLNSVLITNTKKLITSNDYMTDLLKTNFWTTNNIYNYLNTEKNLIKTFSNNLEEVYENKNNLLRNSQNINDLWSVTGVWNQTNESFLTYNEVGFDWLLKKMQTYDYLNTRLPETNIKSQKHRNLEFEKLKELKFILYKLNTNFVTFTDNSAGTRYEVDSLMNSFYNNSRNTMSDYNTSTLLNELCSNRTNQSNVSYFYFLNRYSKFLSICNEETDFVLITNPEEMRLILKTQPQTSLAAVDLLNKEYTKNLYCLAKLF